MLKTGSTKRSPSTVLLEDRSDDIDRLPLNDDGSDSLRDSFSPEDRATLADHPGNLAVEAQLLADLALAELDAKQEQGARDHDAGKEQGLRRAVELILSKHADALSDLDLKTSAVLAGEGAVTYEQRLYQRGIEQAFNLVNDELGRVRRSDEPVR